MITTRVNEQKNNFIGGGISGISLKGIKDTIFASTKEQINLRNKCILIGIIVIILLAIAIWGVSRIIRNSTITQKIRELYNKRKVTAIEAEADRIKAKLEQEIKEQEKQDLDEYAQQIRGAYINVKQKSLEQEWLEDERLEEQVEHANELKKVQEQERLAEERWEQKEWKQQERHKRALERQNLEHANEIREMREVGKLKMKESDMIFEKKRQEKLKASIILNTQKVLEMKEEYRLEDQMRANSNKERKERMKKWKEEQKRQDQERDERDERLDMQDLVRQERLEIQKMQEELARLEQEATEAEEAGSREQRAAVNNARNN
ncbi:hypothetical protein NEPAR06_2404 [Nematocida parisii]|nr:hypothetical protein NEPAR08_1094 [Nematocida parisii]KAI5128374.1 hypothetical protein NEPAR03_1283 [Nematocida parisii]KAI5141698.1 hypothetical protein NEPAR04_1170 [Nematocida parisii]KAI5146538.1 hypothetical protein NEPAR07_2456 [Nematocida parisii]KAI5157199.1 hypothetical protein NEPAR06_2404 [Nematocida parisii]